jgi:uncharacterized protein affecting Mg2+/Co2+ transport
MNNKKKRKISINIEDNKNAHQKGYKESRIITANTVLKSNKETAINKILRSYQIADKTTKETMARGKPTTKES